MRTTKLTVIAVISVVFASCCSSEESFDFQNFVANSPAFKAEVQIQIGNNEIQPAKFWEERSHQMNGLMLPVFGDQCSGGQVNVVVGGLQGAIASQEFTNAFANWLVAQGYLHRNVYTLRKMYNGKEQPSETRTCLIFDEQLKQLVNLPPSETVTGVYVGGSSADGRYFRIGAKNIWEMAKGNDRKQTH